MTQAPRYGVKEQTVPADAVEGHIERLSLNGFTYFDAGLSSDKQASIATAFDRAFTEQAGRHGGVEMLAAIDEHNTIRAPLLYDPVFLDLAQNPVVLALAEHVFRGNHGAGAYILNQQNGISNPPGGPYNQGAWHRDLPYQHFISSRPLAINALYCIDPFTTENGATLVAPGTHRQEAFPSDSLLEEIALQVAVPAGHFLVLDCMLYHSGGANRSDAVRRAVNHVYTLPFIRQQIDLPSAMGPSGTNLPEDVRKLVGYGNDAVSGPADYYARRRARLGGAGA